MNYKNNHHVGNGIRIDGINDFVSFFTPTLGHFTKDQDFTISAFLRFNSVDTAGGNICPIFSDLDNSINNGKGYLFTISPTLLFFTQRADFSTNHYAEAFCNNSNIQIGGFYHAVIVKQGTDANNWLFYLNGELQTTISGQNTLTGTAERLNSNFTIGQLDGVFFGGMDLHNLQVFDRAISEKEVKRIYRNKGNVLTSTLFNSLVFDFKINESQGLTLRENKQEILANLYGFPASGTFVERNGFLI